jgi:hypothetical protein
MTSLDEYALKGYFQELKDEVNRQVRGGQNRLLDLLKKAVGALEEVYEKDFNLLHPDNAIDYREMIEALNQHGIEYSGKKEILELAAARFNPEPKTFEKPQAAQPEKLPMKKASGKKNIQDEERRKLG